jgi:hypothetical protein
MDLMSTNMLFPMYDTMLIGLENSSAACLNCGPFSSTQNIFKLFMFSSNFRWNCRYWDAYYLFVTQLRDPFLKKMLAS